MTIFRNKMERKVMLFCVCFAISFNYIYADDLTINEKQDRVTFSTKTPYKLVENLDTFAKKPEGCRAVQLNMVFRHGTRFPSASDVRMIQEMLEVLNDCIGDREDIKHYIKDKLGLSLENPYNKSDDKLLTKIGDLELYNLGLRYRKRFPDLFEKPFSVHDLKFISTCKERSSQSASAFAMGFLEGKGDVGPSKLQPIPLEMNPCSNDEILRYFDMCKKYIKRVEDNEQASLELKKFLHGPVVEDVLNKVKEKLKMTDRCRLTPTHIKMMYLTCAYGIGIKNETLNSPWCNLFDRNDFNVMEYVLDLKAFYKRSAAYRITYESSCPLLRDILHSIQAKAGRRVNYKKWKGIFRSSHAETLVPLYALMGLLLDERPLKADNYEEMQDRQFRGSNIAPFAGNLAFVLYKCPRDTYKIQLYNNERLLKFPCCKSAVDCPLELFEACYEQISNECDFHAMCKIHDDNALKGQRE